MDLHAKAYRPFYRQQLFLNPFQIPTCIIFSFHQFAIVSTHLFKCIFLNKAQRQMVDS